MSNPFLTAVLNTLRESGRYRLSAIIEMAALAPTDRDRLREAYAQRSWPLLHQAQFSNLRDLGPWLFAARPGAELSGQYDFQCTLERSAGDAVCGWIVSAMPPAQLARHLAQANTVIGTDGHPYLLRYHTTFALRALQARRELPGINEWLTPIRHWWVPIASANKRLWSQVSGYDRPEAIDVPPLELDQACWEALAGEPLSHYLAELLGRAEVGDHCHGTRLGLVEHFLGRAREAGLSQRDDLIHYVLMMTQDAARLGNGSGWEQALAATRDQALPLSIAVKTHLQPSRSEA